MAVFGPWLGLVAPVAAVATAIRGGRAMLTGEAPGPAPSPALGGVYAAEADRAGRPEPVRQTWAERYAGTWAANIPEAMPSILPGAPSIPAPVLIGAAALVVLLLIGGRNGR